MFLVLPKIPGDYKTFWDPPLTTAWSNQQVLIGGYSFCTSPKSLPYAFKKDREEANKLAQDYAKTYNQPYYISEVSIYGRYAPPPPAFEMIYEDVGPVDNWKVPK